MSDLAISDMTGGELAELGPAVDFTEAWLNNRRFAANTRDAYRRDIHQFLAWCARHQLDPLQLTFLHINAWGRELEQPGETEEGRPRKPLAPTSAARKMSAVSSWYRFIVKLGKLQANPAAVADRPEVDRDFSATTSFSREDAQRILAAASLGDRYMGAAGPLLAGWLVQMGTRASETLRVDLADLGHQEGHRTVVLTLKGGSRQRRALPPPVADELERYLAARAQQEGVPVDQLSGPLFVDRDGNTPDRYELARFVRRLAVAAKVQNASVITPHSFRHAWNSMARAAGASLEDRQDAMGHRDPRTTRRYDRAGRSLMHDPSLMVAAAVARRPNEYEGLESGS